MVPYLKGLHLTLESWREDRNNDGWKLSPTEWAAMSEKVGSEGGFDSHSHGVNGSPLTVAPVPRFADDVRALELLTRDEEPPPPRVLVRPVGHAVAAIMFGDASETGLGASLWIQGSSSVDAEYGMWTRAYGSQSSNFREFYNLVAKLETLVKEETLTPGTEIFVFTDN
ncbi:hypothetical protein ACA910_011951 [Epithemia clementina (nom. ined.)]